MVLSLLSFGSMLQATSRYFANFDGIVNSCRTVALWVTLSLLLAFIITKVQLAILSKISKKYSKEQIKQAGSICNLIWLTIAVVLAAALIITFTACYFTEVKAGEDSFVAITYYPLLTFILVTCAGALAVFLKPVKIVKITVCSLIGAAFVAAFICLCVYYASGDAEEWNFITLKDGQNAGLYVSAILLVAAVILLSFFADRKSKTWNSRSLSFAAVCVALSFALSYVRIFKMPMGGSITVASMLPLMLFSYIFGARKGIIAGLILGILQAVQDPWILHPAQFLLDYPVAFASIGLAGCIKGFNILNKNARAQFTLGAVVAGGFRFLAHFFSGAFAFGSYGASYAEQFAIPALSNEFLYSFIYQTLYVIPEILIVIVAGVLLLSSKNFLKTINRYGAEDKTASNAPLDKSPIDNAEKVKENCDKTVD